MIKKDKLFKLLNNVDAVLVTSQNNRKYFTEFSGTFGYLIMTKDKAFYITDSRYYQMACESMKDMDIDIVLCNGYADAFVQCEKLLKELNAVNIGFENTEITVFEYEGLKNTLSQFTFVPVGEQILKIREVKDQDELDDISHAQTITDSAFTKILDYIKKDVSELDIAVELEYQMRKLGADGLAFDSIVASGENTSKPHAHPTMKKIKLGDAITMDFGARFNGYCSDMTRTVFFGKPSDEMKNIYNIVYKAQMAVINNVKVGMSGREVDMFARELITANGFKDNFQHGLGHSVGIDIHERPTMNAVSNDVLVENNLITVEPGIYVPNLGGVRIEDLIIIKNDKIIDLTTSQKDIIIL